MLWLHDLHTWDWPCFRLDHWLYMTIIIIWLASKRWTMPKQIHNINHQPLSIHTPSITVPSTWPPTLIYQMISKKRSCGYCSALYKIKSMCSNWVLVLISRRNESPDLWICVDETASLRCAGWFVGIPLAWPEMYGAKAISQHWSSAHWGVQYVQAVHTWVVGSSPDPVNQTNTQVGSPLVIPLWTENWLDHFYTVIY